MEENLINKFKKHVEDFDFSNNMISRKFYHTLRVAEYAKRIAKSENLNEHDYNLAFICALLHDIGRFEQAKLYNTYDDLKSVDHGNLGYEILLRDNYISEYVTDDIDKQIVLKSVQNHNKLSINPSLNDRELFFTKLIRDADKLDILDKQKNEISDGNGAIEEQAIQLIKEHKLFKRDTIIRTNATDIVLTISFIFDINFKKSFEILKENKTIENKLNVLREYCDNNLVNIIETELYSYIDKKIT